VSLVCSMMYSIDAVIRVRFVVHSDVIIDLETANYLQSIS
jgi:hypothetical protein